jgi:hypothetical protein
MKKKNREKKVIEIKKIGREAERQRDRKLDTQRERQ